MFSILDIGSNSVLMLIAEALPDGSVRVLDDIAETTRLGEGLAASGIISDAAAGRTLEALRRFLERCRRRGASDITAFGTEALRKAENAAAFREGAQHELGLAIDVLSPEREAALAFSASARDFGSDIVVLDIGGGSTEIVAPHSDGSLAFVSLPLGCVSLTERHLANDPPTEDDVARLRQDIHATLDGALDPHTFARPHDRTLIATGGTATTLAAMDLALEPYDAARVHGHRLRIDQLRNCIDAMRALPISERRRMRGLAPKRADVILAGAEILQEAMGLLGSWEVTVSDRGVRWGMLYEKIGATAKACDGAIVQ